MTVQTPKRSSLLPSTYNKHQSLDAVQHCVNAVARHRLHSITMFSPGRLRRDDDEDWGCIGDGEGHGRMSQLGERPQSAMRTTPSHLRNVTEDLRRPPPQSVRGRSNTTTDSDVSSGPRPPLIQTESEGYDRRSAAFSTYSRTERSASIGRTLRSKASRLLRRQESTGNYSLRTIDWSEELDDSPYQTASGPSMTVKRNIRLPGRWSPPECKPTGSFWSLQATY